MFAKFLHWEDCEWQIQWGYICVLCVCPNTQTQTHAQTGFLCLEVIGRTEQSNKWANCSVNDLSSAEAEQPVFNSATAIRNTLTLGFDGHVKGAWKPLSVKRPPAYTCSHTSDPYTHMLPRTCAQSTT